MVKRCCLSAGLLCLIGMAFPFTARAADIPLTAFRPSLDFFPVPNGDANPNVVWRGNCLGIAESAVTRFDTIYDKNGATKHLTDIAADIINSRGKRDGEVFLEEMNTLARNISYSDLPKAPRTGPWLADWHVDEMTRTHKPQVLGLDLPDGKRHALVAYDATKTGGKIKLRVGDPSFPDKDDLYIVYDPAADRWDTEGFPSGAFPAGEIRPAFVRWDEARKRPANISRRNMFHTLFRKIEQAALNKSITARTIANDKDLAVSVPLPSQTPKTITVKDRPAAESGNSLVGTWTDGKKTYRFESGGKFVVEPAEKGKLEKSSWEVKGNTVKATVKIEGVFDNGAVQLPEYIDIEYIFTDIQADHANFTWERSVVIVDGFKTTGKGEIRKK